MFFIHRRASTTSPFGVEDTSQQVNFYYDINPLDSSNTFSQYTAGRLAAVKYGAVFIGGLNIIPQFAEWYNYTQAGGIATKRLQLSETVAGPLNFDAQYTYDGEGKMTSVTYPTTYGWNGNTLVPTPGPTYTYSFDTMSRPIGLTDANNNSLVSGVSYGPANELLGISYLGAFETRTYNTRLQLTNITAPGLNVTYNYTAGANNGKIASATDNGETIQYTYDSLNRLYMAAFAAGTQRYDYDGFGNLTAKAVVSGSVPTMSVGVDPNTNRLAGVSYDANGNQTTYGYYDVENRLYTIPSVLYAYDARNKRVWKGLYDSNNNLTSQEIYFYGIDGKKLATDNVLFSTSTILSDTLTDQALYFGNRQVGKGDGNSLGYLVFDRLGSRRYNITGGSSSFYPYGEDKGTPVANDQLKFATYTRDSLTGLDYADQRYYNSTYGRFMSPDPYQANGLPTAPQSWNPYAYSNADPINGHDPSGLLTVPPDDPSGGILNIPGDVLAQVCGGAPFSSWTLGLFTPIPKPLICYVFWAAAPAFAGGGASTRRTPNAIRAIYDCWTRRVVPGVGAVYERDITYITVDQNGDEMSDATISEHLRLIKGSNKPPESSAKDRFFDQIAVGGEGIFEVIQTFSVTINGFVYSNLPIYNAFGQQAPGKQNDIFAGPSGVLVNNDDRSKNGSCR